MHFIVTCIQMPTSLLFLFIVHLLISVLFLFSVFASDTGENQPL